MLCILGKYFPICNIFLIFLCFTMANAWYLLYFRIYMSGKYNKMRPRSPANRKNVVSCSRELTKTQHLLSPRFFVNFTTYGCDRYRCARQSPYQLAKIAPRPTLRSASKGSMPHWLGSSKAVSPPAIRTAYYLHPQKTSCKAYTPCRRCISLF